MTRCWMSAGMSRRSSIKRRPPAKKWVGS